MKIGIQEQLQFHILCKVYWIDRKEQSPMLLKDINKKLWVHIDRVIKSSRDFKGYTSNINKNNVQRALKILLLQGFIKINNHTDITPLDSKKVFDPGKYLSLTKKAKTKVNEYLNELENETSRPN